MNHNSITICGRMVADGDFTKGSEDKRDRLWGRLAVERDGVGADGKKVVDFIPFCCWGGTARAVAKFCKKGKILLLEGRLQTRSKTREDGTYDNYAEVNCSRVTFGPDAKNAGQPAAAAPAATPATPSPAQGVDIAAQMASLLANPAMLAALLAQGAAAQAGASTAPPADSDNPFA